LTVMGTDALMIENGRQPAVPLISADNGTAVKIVPPGIVPPGIVPPGIAVTGQTEVPAIGIHGLFNSGPSCYGVLMPTRTESWTRPKRLECGSRCPVVQTAVIAARDGLLGILE